MTEHPRHEIDKFICKFTDSRLGHSPYSIENKFKRAEREDEQIPKRIETIQKTWKTITRKVEKLNGYTSRKTTTDIYAI